MSKSVAIIVGILVLGFVALAVFYPEQPEAPKIGQQHESEGQQHLQSVDEPHAPYRSNPPTSGPHASPAPWGVSTVEVPAEQYIHNMEHGGVIITYQPSLPADKVAQLTEIAQNLTVKDDQQSNKGFKVILTPRAANTAPIQLSSWLWSLDLQTVERSKIQQFYRDHLNNAPEASAT